MSNELLLNELTPESQTPELPVCNPGNRHVAMLLLLDTSRSMDGASIEELNRSLVALKDALMEDEMARTCADIAVVTFNSAVETTSEFSPATSFQPPVLQASGFTAMNEAIGVGLETVEDRISFYKAVGINYYRPWFVLLTDGEPTDSELEESAKNAIRTAISNEKIVFFPVAIGSEANVENLRSYYPEDADKKLVLSASSTNFKELFVWLSRSISKVTGSDPAVSTNVQLAPLPTNIVVPLL